MRTTERFQAVKLARKLCAESNRLIDVVAMNRISSKEAVLYLEAVAAREVDRKLGAETEGIQIPTRAKPIRLTGRMGHAINFLVEFQNLW